MARVGVSHLAGHRICPRHHSIILILTGNRRPAGLIRPRLRHIQLAVTITVTACVGRIEIIATHAGRPVVIDHHHIGQRVGPRVRHHVGPRHSATHGDHRTDRCIGILTVGRLLDVDPANRSIIVARVRVRHLARHRICPCHHSIILILTGQRRPARLIPPGLRHIKFTVAVAITARKKGRTEIITTHPERPVVIDHHHIGQRVGTCVRHHVGPRHRTTNNDHRTRGRIGILTVG